MRILFTIILIIITALIKIGDSVIFLGSFLLKQAKRVFSFPVRVFKKLAALPFPKLKLSLPRLRIPQIKLTAPSRRVSKKRTHHLSRKPKRKQILTSPSFSILSKLKYFTTGVFFSAVFLFIPLLLFIFLQDLPSPKSIWLGQIPQTTKIYDRNGALLYQLYAYQDRTIVPLNTIPLKLQQATIAIEDKDFYQHPGFDPSAIIRSFVENMKGGQLQGGSTITQQLIKSALLTPETSLIRKIKEVILAFMTERMYTKQQILEMYFNQIPYGGTAWGVETASETYFGKNVKDLTLAQSAFLAGIPRAPTIYSPYGTTPTAWKKRQKEVLTRMLDLNYITPKEAQEALAQELNFRPRQNAIKAPHFVMYVKDYLVRRYGLAMVEKGGLTVITSLDLDKQKMAERIVADEVAKNAYLNLTNGATLITNPQNGDILAMIGSKRFDEPNIGNFNVTVSPRQPGSSIKVVTYATALTKGYTAASILDDSPVTFVSQGGPAYSPVNYDGRFHGRVSLRYALANSFNVPAVRLLNNVGLSSMIEYGKNMGIKSWDNAKDYGLSITLGGAETTMLDMASVYGTLSNAGNRVDIDPILKITDSKGNIIQEKKDVSSKRVLDEGVAFIVSDILSDNISRTPTFGASSSLVIPKHIVSVKTGTTDWKRDNWTIGYTDNFVVTVWVGNNDNTPMSPTLASGVTGAAPIWNKVMTNLLSKEPESKRVIPENIVAKQCGKRIEYFIRGTENSISCAIPSPTPAKKN